MVLRGPEIPDEGDERVKLFRVASKLTMAFRVWGIVVGIFGTAALLYLREIKEEITEANTLHATVLERIVKMEEHQARIDERQQSAFRLVREYDARINRIEDEIRQRRER